MIVPADTIARSKRLGDLRFIQIGCWTISKAPAKKAGENSSANVIACSADIEKVLLSG